MTTAKNRKQSKAALRIVRRAMEANPLIRRAANIVREFEDDTKDSYYVSYETRTGQANAIENAFIELFYDSFGFDTDTFIKMCRSEQ